MKKKYMVIASSALVLTFALSACGPKVSAGSQTTTQNVMQETQTNQTAAQSEIQEIQNNEPATLGEIADFLLNAADGRPGLSRDKLLDKIGGEDSGLANRVQALVMVSRAFGPLPAAAEPGDVDLSGIPEWASDDLENLKNSGVLTSNELAGNEEDNQKFLEGDGTDSSNAEQADNLLPDDAKDINNGYFDVIRKADDETSAPGEEQIFDEGPGCPIGGGSSDNPDLVQDIVVPSLSIRSTITLTEIDTIVKRILSLKS